MNARVLRAKAAAVYLGLPVSTFQREVAAGRLPAPLPLTERARGWDRRALDRWIDAKAEDGEAEDDGPRDDKDDWLTP